MEHHIDRRSFIAAAGLGVAATAASGRVGMTIPAGQPERPGANHRGACALASGNGERAVARAWELIGRGKDPAVAAVRGVNIVEEDPEDMSVGYGGLPNEDGIVELDASVMHGPTHKAGAVAAIRDIKNPASVALVVLQRTDHVLLVGEGAKRFALMHGFMEENLLTDAAREAWVKWKERLNPDDDRLDPDQRDWPDDKLSLGDMDVPFTHGTIHCSVRNDAGDFGATTTTSGLSYKIPGRVGDSPIIGAGMYVDNDIGSAGATGRGEAVIQNCGSFAVVQEMGRGADPTEACLSVLERIARNTREKRLIDERGRPNFQVTLYGLRKDGAYGSASLWKGATFAVHDGTSARQLPSAFLYERQ